MSELATFLKKLGVNTLGEVLRDITFVGKGGGCFKNFNVRTDAEPWSHQGIMSFIEKHEELFSFEDQAVAETKGYSFMEGSVRVDVFWSWEEDGTLYFRAREGEEEIGAIINYDCKKNYRWEEV